MCKHSEIRAQFKASTGRVKKFAGGWRKLSFRPRAGQPERRAPARREPIFFQHAEQVLGAPQARKRVPLNIRGSRNIRPLNNAIAADRRDLFRIQKKLRDLFNLPTGGVSVF
jgi:hypothetical protein